MYTQEFVLKKIRMHADREAFRLLMAQQKRQELELQRLNKHKMSM